MDSNKWFFSSDNQLYFSLNRNNSGNYLVAVRTVYGKYTVIKNIPAIPASVIAEIKHSPEEVWKLEKINTPFVKKSNGGRKARR